MGAVELAGAVTDPEEVGRAVVPTPGQAVLPGQRLFVAEQERLVGRVAVDLVERELLVEVDAAGLHEPQRALDLGRDGLVAPALGARGHELLVPGVDAGQVGEAALGERAQEVQRRRGLVVAAQQTPRIGTARGGLEREVVDHVAPEARELDLAAGLERRGPGLGELAGDAAELHGRDPGAVGQHDGHLQDDLELVADAVGRERVERLRAVAGLEQERLALGDVPQRLGQRARLAGEHERREPAELGEHGLEAAVGRPVRLLHDRARPPGVRGPGESRRVVAAAVMGSRPRGRRRAADRRGSRARSPGAGRSR